MEEGERKEKVFFLPPCWRQQEPGKDWLSTIHQEKTSHQKVSKKNRGREKARRRQGEQPGSAARHLPACKVSLEVSKPHCILLAKEHVHGWSSDLGKENNGKWSFIKRNEMGEKGGEKKTHSPWVFWEQSCSSCGDIVDTSGCEWGHMLCSVALWSGSFLVTNSFENDAAGSVGLLWDQDEAVWGLQWKYPSVSSRLGTGSWLPGSMLMP